MSNIDHALNNFLKLTARSKVAIVIPLFGYDDKKNNQLDNDVLRITLDRAYSNAHDVYYFFVGDEKSVSKKVRDIILSKTVGGNAVGVHVPKESTYSEYVKKGIDTAIQETSSEYIVVLNPWVIMQHGVIDTLIDRVNYGDEASVVCGYDLRKKINPEEFDAFKVLVPAEEKDISFNLLAMKRYTAEVLPIDINYDTLPYLQRDIWQTLFSQGTMAIVTQTAPIFSFDIDLTKYEEKTDRVTDEQYFISKWGFSPALNENTNK